MATQSQVSPIEVQKYLKEADYPMERDALVILAEGSQAPDEVLDLLEALPDVDFESAADVQEAFGNVYDEFQRKREKGAQERSQEKKPQDEKPQEGQRRSRKREIEDRKQQLKEETGKLTEPGKTVQGAPDHRLKGQESEAIKSARHMEHGYDGRGQITNPDMDARLAENRAKPEGEEAQAEPPKAKTTRMTWRQHAGKR